MTQEEMDAFSNDLLKFFERTHKKLPKDATSKMRGQLIVKDSTRYVLIYNGNKNWKINTVNINYYRKELKYDISIDPLSEVEVRVDISYYDEAGYIDEVPIISALGEQLKK